jgi:hypothetical protein
MEERLGQPDIELTGLRIWIHERQFPDAMDYWDGNWINVTVHCEATGASVQVRGSIIHLSEVVCLLDGVEHLYNELCGKVEMKCMEPGLSVGLEALNSGHIDMTVNITPDHLSQAH